MNQGRTENRLLHHERIVALQRYPGRRCVGSTPCMLVKGGPEKTVGQLSQIGPHGASTEITI